MKKKTQFESWIEVLQPSYLCGKTLLTPATSIVSDTPKCVRIAPGLQLFLLLQPSMATKPYELFLWLCSVFLLCVAFYGCENGGHSVVVVHSLLSLRWPLFLQSTGSWHTSLSNRAHVAWRGAQSQSPWGPRRVRHLSNWTTKTKLLQQRRQKSHWGSDRAGRRRHWRHENKSEGDKVNDRIMEPFSHEEISKYLYSAVKSLV